VGKTRLAYAVGAGILQALLLGGCSPAAEAPRDGSANASTTVAAPVAAPEGEERLVLAFGDSLYAGYRLGRGEGLPEQIQNRLRTSGINATVVNAGVSGDTTAAGRQRLKFALDSLPRKPDLVILGLGGNDALRQIAPAETRANLVAMMDELKRRNIAVVLTGMRAPPNLGPDYAATFEGIWPDLAKTYGAKLDPFILDAVITDQKLMLPDRIHPNAKGAAKMADRIAPLAAAALNG
jgi:acyl-CoA thioesterase I